MAIRGLGLCAADKYDCASCMRFKGLEDLNISTSDHPN